MKRPSRIKQKRALAELAIGLPVLFILIGAGIYALVHIIISGHGATGFVILVAVMVALYIFSNHQRKGGAR